MDCQWESAPELPRAAISRRTFQFGQLSLSCRESWQNIRRAQRVAWRESLKGGTMAQSTLFGRMERVLTPLPHASSCRRTIIFLTDGQNRSAQSRSMTTCGVDWFVFEPHAISIQKIRCYYAAPPHSAMQRQELTDFDYAARGYPST